VVLVITVVIHILYITHTVLFQSYTRLVRLVPKTDFRYRYIVLC